MSDREALEERRWRKALAAYTREAPPPLVGACALLVVDMQRYFEPLARPIVAAVRRAVEGSRALGVPVIFTRHGHAHPERDGGMLAEWWGELILEGTAEHELLADLGLQPGDPVIAKRRYDAFADTDLEATLRRLKVSELALTGVMTNLCVETTARAAFVRDFQVRVLVDATATASEELQLASLVSLAYGFAFLQSVEEWLESLGRAAR